MKRIIGIVLSAAMLLSILVLAGCGKKYDGEINVYNFGEYIDEQTYKDFEKEYNIKVNYTTYDTCEALYSVLKNGGADYDVVITSDYMVSRMREEGMLHELDFSNIPNYDTMIADEYKNLDYDPDSAYSVPYMWGTVGIIYNPGMVDEEITSWSAMFDERYSGNILMFESTRDAFGVALSYLGYSLNTTDENELREAGDLLKAQNPLLQGYFQDQMYDKLEGGEAAIGVYYAGDYLCMLENNPDLKFVIPKEGSNWFVDVMVIPAGSNKTELGEKFIDYMCRTEVSLANMGATAYASPNPATCESYARGLDDYAAGIMFPDADTMSRCEMFTNLPQETLDLLDALWVEVKA